MFVQSASLDDDTGLVPLGDSCVEAWRSRREASRQGQSMSVGWRFRVSGRYQRDCGKVVAALGRHGPRSVAHRVVDPVPGFAGATMLNNGYSYADNPFSHVDPLGLYGINDATAGGTAMPTVDPRLTSINVRYLSLKVVRCPCVFSICQSHPNQPRRRYPIPRAVTISFGSSGWSSTLTRRRRTCASTRRLSPRYS